MAGPPGLRATWARRSAKLAALCAIAGALEAQAPDDSWRTISTQHFRVHFTPPLESVARRAAGEAERAWVRLSAELVAPRGPIDLVVADNRDLSNGQAQYYPTNRIVIWARPPIDDASLRFSDDWIQQVVTHELAHVFHLDRARGMWRLGQWIFGRHPALFPNARSPRWLMEGLAIVYESRASGGGRLNGTELYAMLEAWQSGGHSAAPGALSLATPYWPAGNVAYFAGARLAGEAQRTGGDSSLRRFIERVGAYPIPYLWDLHAKHAFGASFSALSNRIADTAPPVVVDPGPAVAGPFWELRSPRWRGDTVLFAAGGQRVLSGLFAVSGGAVTRLARRNNVDAFGIAGSHEVYAELDFADPNRLFSAVYIRGRRKEDAGRLSAPDVRADGMIVAVETANGAARLVLVDSAGRRVRDLTAPSGDIQWNAPRWSRGSNRIATTRWLRGGEMDIVVLDEMGRELASFGRARAMQSHPSWDVEDRAIYFTSDRDGRFAGYRVSLAGSDSGVVRRVAEAGFGLSEIEVSPDGARLAGVRMMPDGYELVLMPTASDPREAMVAQASTLRAGLGDTAVSAGGAPRRYSPLRTLIPRYWVPTVSTSNRDEYLVGFYTSGNDVIGRHSIAFEGLWDVSSREFYGNAAWSFRGFGVPVIDAAVSQSWSVFSIADANDVRVGEVTRRNRVAALTLTASRPRIRTGAFAAIGGEYEWRLFETHPPELASQLDPPPPGELKYPTALVAAGWNNLRRTALSLSAEDGISVSATARRRWRTDSVDSTAANSVLATGRAYKSLALPGHARHVIALHGALGWAEPAVNSVFSAGGVSGTSLEVLPGYRIGDAQRAFFVRGFPVGSVDGIRAWGATVEYRAPFPRVGKGLWPLPFFWQRSLITVFGDAASAWCPEMPAPTAACPTGETPRVTIASAGAELQADLTVEYDTPTRFRLGVASPIRGRDVISANRASVYLTLGLPF